MTRDKSPTPAVEAIGRLHLEGNIVPHTLFTRREFKSEKGITQHLAILIYADDLYWYRPTYHRDELTGKVLHITRKFDADMLQRTYAYYANLLGATKAQVTTAVKFLVDRGLTYREFRTVISNDGRPIPNVMFIQPVVEALPFLLQADQCGAPGLCWVADAPQANLKKDESEPGADAQDQPKGRRRKIPSASMRRVSPQASASATVAVTAALAAVPDSKPDQVSGGVSQIDGIYPQNRTDTVSQIDGIYPPNRWDTNTEITTGSSSKNFQRGGVQGSAGHIHPSGQSSTPVAEPSPAVYSSSENLKAEPRTPEGLRNTSSVGPALASVLIVPQVKASQPDGTADAVRQGTLVDSQDFAKPRGGMNEQATSLEKIPGGAAAGAAEGPRGAGDGSGRARVDSVRPLDAKALAARPVELVDGAAHLALKALFGNNLTQLVKEVTRTGGLSRKPWLKLTEEEIGLVRVLAQEEAKATGANMITLVIRGLDHLIGAVKVEKQASKKTRAQEATTGPVDLGHLDPGLQIGDRCVYRRHLGVIFDVTSAHYLVRQDDRELVSADRASAGDLRALQASDAPAPAAAPVLEGSTVFAPTGSSWRRVTGKGGQVGEVITVQAVLGTKRKLSTGGELAFYTIQKDFEPVSV